jgi:alpha-2-macroglobulin
LFLRGDAGSYTDTLLIAGIINESGSFVRSMIMKRVLLISIICVGCILVFFTGCSQKNYNQADMLNADQLYQPDTREQEVHLVTGKNEGIRERKPERVSVYTNSYIEPGRPIDFRFSMSMIRERDIEPAGLGPAILSISFTPDIPGTYKWLSATKLSFIPGQEALHAGETYLAVVSKAVPLGGESFGLNKEWSGEIRVRYLEIAGKVATWPVVPGYPRFIQALTSYTDEVGQGPVLLLYDQVVKPNKIKSHIRVTTESGRRLKFKVKSPGHVDYVFDWRTPKEIIGLYIQNLPGNGEIINIEVPEWYSPDVIKRGEKPGKRSKTFSLTVNKRFKVTDVEKPGRREDIFPLKSKIYFTVNNKYSYAQLQNSITINPPPISSYTYQDWEGVIVFSAQFKPGTDYVISFTGSPKDVLGNPLEPYSLSFRSQDLPPVLEVPVYPIVLEKGKNNFQVKVRNLDDMEARVYTYTEPEKFAQVLSYTNKKNGRDYHVSGKYKTYPIKTRKLSMNDFHTVDVAIGNNPGLMCVEIRGQGLGSEATGTMTNALLAQNTNIGITTKVMKNKLLVWTTTLDTALILKNTTINLVSNTGKHIARGKTDKEGVVIFNKVRSAAATGVLEPISVIAEKSYESAVSRIVNDELSNAWQFGLPGKVKDSGLLRASLFTERGIYRPGEDVYIKTIVSLEDARKGDAFLLIVNNPRGKEIINTTLKLDAYGAADHDFRLNKDAPVGEYVIHGEMGNSRVTHTFKVEEYRIPTFLVTVTTGDDEWVPGGATHVLISAEYMHGGKLGGREVKWSVFRQYEAFTSRSYPDYQFALKTDTTLNTFIARDETKLNGQGDLPVRLSLGHLDVSGTARYIVEAAVTDVDRQTYAGRMSRVVHSSSFYLGVLPPTRAVVAKGETITVPVVAVTPDHKSLQKVKITATLERIDYHTTARLSESGKVQLFSRQVPEKVKQKKLVTGKSGTICDFDLPKAGYYRVRFTASDRKKREVETGFIITATGDEETAWPRFDKDQIELVADKGYYSPGETAFFAIQSPYKKATGLLTVERDDILYYRSLNIKNDTPMIPLYIERSYSPNAFASIALVRGRIHNSVDATGYETGAPGFKIGYKKLRVALLEERLNVETKSREKVVQPGDEVRVDISLTDYRGKPAPGQVTLMVVDEAVLSLTNHKTPNPLAGLYMDYPLGIRTGTLYFDLPHSRRSRRETMFPGGGFGDDMGVSYGVPLSLRKLFKSTVYWNPDIRIDRYGQTSVKFRLPDNTTTYRIMVVASDSSSRAGSGENSFVSRKPLMIQPALPRFLYPGDEFDAEILVYNGTPLSGNITVQGEFSGVDLTAGSLVQTKRARQGESTSFTFKVKARKAGTPVFRFAARMKEYNDAAEYTLPLLEPGTKQVDVKSVRVQNKDSLTMDIPRERVKGSLGLEVVASSTPLSELKDSVQYLMRYPNGCIEQTTSGAYPLVILGDLLPDIGVEVDRAKLKEFTKAGVDRLLSFQTTSGGLSYWPGSNEPHAFGTAFGLTALIEAKKKGYDVPDNTLKQAADYLESQLRRGEISGEMPHGGMADADTKALIVMTLGRLGRPQSSYISTLWRKREHLTGFGLSFLALAVKEKGGEQALLQDILEEIRKRATEKRDEAYFEGKRDRGYSMGSPLRTHGGSLAAYAASSSTGQMAGKLLTGLLNRKQRGLWGNTQENVFGMMGVYQASLNKVGTRGPSIILDINGSSYSSKNMEKLSTNLYTLSFTESELPKNRISCSITNKASGIVYLTMRMNYEVPLTRDFMKAQSRGITFKRTYRTMEGKSLEGKTIKLGSLVRVHCELETDKDLYYCAIDDKLPAGLEPVNMNLATTESLELGKITDTIQRGLTVLSYHEIRDHRVAFYVDEMLKNKYEFTYIARATTPGTFLRPAGRGEAMYEPEIYGTTGIDYITIK